MAAEPVPLATLWQINIAPGGTVSTNGSIKIANTDSITFHNNATFPVTITFTSSFNSIVALQPGKSQAPTPISGAPLNITIDYTVSNSNTSKQTGGPYAVEFGMGPLTVTIQALNTSPDPIAVTSGGQLVFVCDAKYDIVWTQGQTKVTPWSPQPPKLYANANPNPNPVQTALPQFSGQTVTYTITDGSNTHGGGTVGIGS